MVNQSTKKWSYKLNYYSYSIISHIQGGENSFFVGWLVIWWLEVCKFNKPVLKITKARKFFLHDEVKNSFELYKKTCSLCAHADLHSGTWWCIYAVKSDRISKKFPELVIEHFGHKTAQVFIFTCTA